MSKHLVLSAKSYDFNNNNTGERVTGVKVAYINKKPSKRENEVGHTPLIVNINDSEVIEKLKGNVPGVFDMEFEQVTGKNNKPEIMLSDVEFISSVDLPQLFV